MAGHDRGGRVAHRMALDHPDRVERRRCSTSCRRWTLSTHVDQAFATAYYHWFFLIQPAGLPERMIGRDPQWFLRRTLGSWAGRARPRRARRCAEYERCFPDPAAIHAMCEDYRAAATIDLAHDPRVRLRDKDRRACLVLGERGVVGPATDAALEVWRSARRGPGVDDRGSDLPVPGISSRRRTTPTTGRVAGVSSGRG